MSRAPLGVPVEDRATRRKALNARGGGCRPPRGMILSSQVVQPTATLRQRTAAAAAVAARRRRAMTTRSTTTAAFPIYPGQGSTPFWILATAAWAYVGSWVAEVALAHSDGATIRRFRQKREALMKLRRARAGPWGWRRGTRAECAGGHHREARPQWQLHSGGRMRASGLWRRICTTCRSSMAP